MLRQENYRKLEKSLKKRYLYLKLGGYINNMEYLRVNATIHVLNQFGFLIELFKLECLLSK